MYGLSIVNGDFSVRGDGNVEQVTGRKRLEQELSHWLLEPLGTDTLYPRFGSSLDNLIGSPVLDEYLADVRSEVARVVSNYVEYQKRQVNEDRLQGDVYFLQNWSDEDIIESVDAIAVRAVADTVRVTVKLTTVAGSEVTVTQTA